MYTSANKETFSAPSIGVVAATKPISRSGGEQTAAAVGVGVFVGIFVGVHVGVLDGICVAV